MKDELAARRQARRIQQLRRKFPAIWVPQLQRWLLAVGFLT
jgi:hypothetical protein